MAEILTRPESLTKIPFHYCPGCTHGIAHRLVAEVIDELGLMEKTIGVASVGCSVLAYDYFNLDMQQAAHGRAPAVATGIKRALPDRIVFTYQGDGDLASIGMGEIVHAAGRGENITVIFINNSIYGMTGGQMAPTTLMGQKTTTTPEGRTKDNGFPLKVSEMLATLDGVAYIARVALFDPGQVIKAKKAIKTAFTVQEKGLGFSLVEILSTCPTNWGLSPVKALKYVKETMAQYYPPGEFKKPEGVW
ncbi:thiamine pyrophosphate-dependent enzyme [Carboxydothermus hydrogenoformans]|uniref:Putative keto/oxoacid ferredoxin oxidoreductase, beta subunit n=1 Tax=Carboxydothermus hydrogenoformans (strain ATCC BAA-161 / DSM 6008 / Z-2901) TaxID=246194 RepID=Q3AEK2_CARHZ|nr:thiamine pyrophosphate-dependent enzyme [Carboxydothermus hydrogenoformans]ABB15126.1 putative keto/oxoacid ferredoxin oxidoreductase, beta subunit [Carboxydothermus hydrogenoformans Z-2901]